MIPDLSPKPVRNSAAKENGLLREGLKSVSRACTGCDLCQQECAFLKRYGKPKEIAGRYDPTRKEDRGMPFECSLCGLCTAVCPEGVDPADLFLRMREDAVRQGGADFPKHNLLKGYERRGASKAYSFYGLPKGCDTVFFPGCTLSGTRSERVILAFQKLQQAIPTLGIVLDCCMKPSHDLGRTDHFAVMFGEMRAYLLEQGVRNVLVACPNCYKVFARHGAGLSPKTIYELLAENPAEGNGGRAGAVTVHDPCAVRFEPGIHAAVRKLIGQAGHPVEEMAHNGQRTLCCGEGGVVGALAPALAATWGKCRQKECNGRKIITYCAGCANRLSALTPTEHLIDLLWEGEAGKAKVAKAPLTYWKRLRLKKWFQDHLPAAATRERTFTGAEAPKRRSRAKPLLFLLFLAAALVTVRSFTLSRHLDPETLRTWIAGYGVLAPMVYVSLYAVAPILFLPGFPITVAGGVLFGPVWGAFYAITGATLGACLAFLVSRYLAREWVAGQMKSPRWRRLDEGVEKQGWKVVAFTRLIPLFPFNLLNYAFGLTKIGFRAYAVATFFGMLPACIAFIVFSSSLLDLIRGEISPAFVIGIALIALVSLFPLFYRRYKAKRGEDDPV